MILPCPVLSLSWPLQSRLTAAEPGVPLPGFLLSLRWGGEEVSVGEQGQVWVLDMEVRGGKGGHEAGDSEQARG